jgi:hypothetical protein
MLADDVIWKMLTENIQNEEYHLTYQIASFEDRTYVPHVALCALHTTAVISFAQVFGTGNGEAGAIANNKTEKLRDLRNEMKEYVVSTLGWDGDKYDVILGRILELRDKQVAHYDGKQAEYEEPSPTLRKMKAPYVNFAFDQEREDFVAMISTTYEFVQTNLLPSLEEKD